MRWYLKVLRQYADFSGRARRKEYWMFILFNSIFSWAILIMELFLGAGIEESFEAGLGIGIFSIIYSLVMLIPNLAVVVRRLHDVDKSGWMLLISFIPIIGAIWLLVLLVTDSSPGENQYGKNPKE